MGLSSTEPIIWSTSKSASVYEPHHFRTAIQMSSASRNSQHFTLHSCEQGQVFSRRKKIGSYIPDMSRGTCLDGILPRLSSKLCTTTHPTTDTTWQIVRQRNHDEKATLLTDVNGCCNAPIVRRSESLLAVYWVVEGFSITHCPTAQSWRSFSSSRPFSPRTPSA
jgi:hypothetical protein